MPWGSRQQYSMTTLFNWVTFVGLQLTFIIYEVTCTHVGENISIWSGKARSMSINIIGECQKSWNE